MAGLPCPTTRRDAVPARPRAVLLACALALVALGTAAAGPAAAAPLIGIGDQKPAMFDDPRFRWLGIRHARLVVSWNVALKKDWEAPLVDRWLRDARAAGIRPLVGFGYDFARRDQRRAPSTRAYRRGIRAFRARWPWVRELITWNEANHCSQPTCRKPRQVARYFDAARSACPRCTVVAASVLDQPNMVRWIRSFRRAAHHRPRIWGLHNYVSVNRLQVASTRRFLRTVKGRVWLTETGGVVWRGGYKRKVAFEESPEHAAIVTSHLLTMAGRYHRRVRRVYLYHWNASALATSWDSALIDQHGGVRPAFAVLARYRGRDPARAPGTAPRPAPPPAPPNETPPPEAAPPSGSEPAQPPPQQQPPPPSEPEDDPPCNTPLLCPVLGGG